MSLSLIASICFIQLARELREDELAPFDAALARTIVPLRGRLDVPMLALTRVGAGIPLAGVVVVCVVALSLARRRRAAAYLAVAGTGTLLLNVALKLLFQRARPSADLLYQLTTPGSFSFPSGHAMGSTGVLLSLLVLCRVLRVRGPLFAVACLSTGLLSFGIAGSRVYFGVHYPSDVIGGQLAATAWICAVTGWFYPRLIPGEAATKPADIESPLTER